MEVGTASVWWIIPYCLCSVCCTGHGLMLFFSCWFTVRSLPSTIPRNRTFESVFETFILVLETMHALLFTFWQKKRVERNVSLLCDKGHYLPHGFCSLWLVDVADFASLKKIWKHEDFSLFSMYACSVDHPWWFVWRSGWGERCRENCGQNSRGQGIA